MSDHEPRLFADDAAIRRLGEGLIACALERSEWTHEAHLASCAYLLVERPDILPERDLPGLARVALARAALAPRSFRTSPSALRALSSPQSAGLTPSAALHCR